MLSVRTVLKTSRLLTLTLALCANAAFAAKQIVSVPSEEVAVGPEASLVTFAVSYATEPDLTQTTGLQLRVHYDSSKLKFIENTSETCDKTLASCVNGDISDLTGFQDKEDTGNEDEKTETDRVVLAAYSSASTKWPELQFIKDGAIVDLAFPAELFTLAFEKVDATFEGVTGLEFTAGTGPGNEVEVPTAFAVRFKGDEIPPEISLSESSVTIEATSALTNEDNSQALADFISTISVTDNKDTLTTDNIVAYLTNADGELEEAPEGFEVGIYEITLIAADSAGNKSEPVLVTLSVVDTTGPVITGAVNRVFAAVDASGTPANQPEIEAFGDSITAFDAVSGPIEIAYDAPDQFPLGETTVMLSATDAAGNTTSETLVVTITDQAAPVIGAVTGATLEASGPDGYVGSLEGVIAKIAIVDNVDVDPVITLSTGSNGPLPLGLTSVNFTATDAAGNAVSGVIDVTVVDTTAPTISGDNIEIEGSAGLPLLGSDPQVSAWLESVSASDLVDGDVAVAYTTPSQFAFGESTVVTFTAKDVAGNIATAEYSLSVSPDDVLPEIVAPAAVTVEATSAEGVLITNSAIVAFLASATASDNVDGDVSANVTNNAPQVFNLGETTVVFTILDSSSNSAQATATVTVVDTTPPVISGAFDKVFAAVDASGTPANQPELEAFGNSITANDLVSGVIEVTDDAPPVFPLGDTIVTLMATDSAGNTATDTLKITISDQNNPSITATDQTLEATGPNGLEVITPETLIGAFTATDNVGVEAVVLVGGETLPIGSTVVTATASDAAGNQASATFVVTVVDTTAPAISGAVQLILTVDEAQPVSSSDGRVAAWVAAVTAVDLVDGTVTVTSQLPEEFDVGENPVSFTAVDSRGNESSENVVVLVAVGPAVKVADSITVVSIDGEAVSSTQSQIAAFVAAATATDFSGGALDVTNDAPDSFGIGETVVTFTAVDAEERQGQNSASVTVIVASGDNDTDGDGIDDLFEVQNSLDPNDADDAEGDADGDGRSNLDEYLEGKDPNADDVAPVVTAPAAVSAGATGSLTKVALGDASAVDTLDGELIPVADNPGPYAPGTYTVTWTASDAAGNEGSATQSVIILPQVATAPRGRTAEGATFDVKVVLNGPASAYPVEVPVNLGGTADLDSDYTVTTDMIVIESGRMGMMTITVLEDDVEEGTEVIEVTLGEPTTGAVLGTAITSMINIVEAAEPPALRLDVSQGEQKGRKVAAAGGAVVVMLSITDPNGTHTVEWMSGSEAVVATSEAGAMTFEFDPADLAEGGYEISAMVTDSGIADETFSIGTRVLVSAVEVEADSDGDGVPDSKDTSEESNVIAVNADVGDATVTADEGVTLILGDAAQASNTAGIAVSEETIAAGGADGSGESSKGEDEDFDYPGGVYDFSVQGLIPGDTVRLVIPIPTGIPADAVARKYTDTDGWYDFVLDEMNMVASAPGEDGACPSVGSEAYLEGLTEGDTCLQLTVEDGGPNDADGVVNGEYKDPSGIAAPAPVRVVEVLKIPASAPKVGGGCSASQGPGDFGLLLLALLGLIGLFRKRLQVPSTR